MKKYIFLRLGYPENYQSNFVISSHTSKKTSEAISPNLLIPSKKVVLHPDPKPPKHVLHWVVKAKDSL